MRDKRFVAVHRGGPLTKDHHHQLISGQGNVRNRYYHLLTRILTSG